jgi:sugar phosphate isomerase/epimerase
MVSSSLKKWNPILDEFKKCGVKFALEVHPTEIAFDIATAETRARRTL